MKTCECLRLLAAVPARLFACQSLHALQRPANQALFLHEQATTVLEGGTTVYCRSSLRSTCAYVMRVPTRRRGGGHYSVLWIEPPLYSACVCDACTNQAERVGTGHGKGRLLGVDAGDDATLFARDARRTVG